MFDKLKQLKQLKEIQENLKKEKIEKEKEGIKLVINGNMEMEELIINSDLTKEKQEKIIISLFNESVREVQMIVAKKMSQFKDLGL